MPSLIYPKSQTLEQIPPIFVPTLIQNNPIFGLFPTMNSDTWVVRWEQENNWGGATQVRGANSPPPTVSAPGIQTFYVEPTVYGEEMMVDEKTILERAAPGDDRRPIDVSTLVAQRYKMLLSRYINRLSIIGWNLLTTGVYNATARNGAVTQTTSFTQRTYTASVGWSTAATSTPLADFRAVQLLGAGFSVDFGRGAVALMNRTTLNYMLINTNTADIGGRRTMGLAGINNATALGELFTGDDLPTIRVFDDGYMDDNATFTRFIPNGKVIVVGRRYDNEPIGNYILARNGERPGRDAGLATKVWETSPYEVPNTIKIYFGSNVACAVKYPSAIVVMNV